MTFIASSASSSNDPPQQSQILGNQAPPTLTEIASIDQTIDTLLALASNPTELTLSVGKSLRAVSNPRFFLRVAERCDRAGDNEEERAKLTGMAERVTTIVADLVSNTEKQLDDRAGTLQNILVDLADEKTGEFFVPLTSTQSDKMWEKIKLLKQKGEVDESLLSTVEAWASKAQKDGLDGMVEILRRVLQTVAAVELYSEVAGLEWGGAGAGADADADAKEEKEKNMFTGAVGEAKALLRSNADDWREMLATDTFAASDEGRDALLGVIQRLIETKVLSMDTGSTRQRVAAEFLGELVTRINAAASSSQD